MSKNIIPIFFSCDDNFVKYTIVSLKSIMENASKEYKYIIHILNTDISEKMKKVVLDMENDNFEILFEDVTDYLKSGTWKKAIKEKR